MVLSVPVATSISADRTLVEAAQEGDQAAFTELYHQYWRLVHGILLARAPRGEVDDLAQDVFLNAYRQLPRLRDPAAFPGWLARIARNRAHDFHRRSQDSVELPDDLPAADPPDLEARQALAAIQALPEAYRETLVLRLVEGLTGPEIAEQTGLTAASVRVNLHRGMKLLREKLERRGPHG
jgi:RNA polymerase sigma-70 factor (ECF subfamily)